MRRAHRRDGLTSFICALVAALSLVSAWGRARLASPAELMSDAARHSTARAEKRLRAIATRLTPARNRQTPSQRERSGE
jgi:hypothetical protein